MDTMHDVKKNCPECQSEMVLFDIIRPYVSYHGHICPECGKWLYRKEDMNKKLDWGQVALMAEAGFNITQTAERLHCTTRQVSRIAKKLNIFFSGKNKNLIGTESEHRLWRLYYKEKDHNYSTTARRFGVTRQAVWERLSKTQEAA